MTNNTDNVVTLTKAAAGFFQKSLENRAQALGIRVGVKRSGCSGYAYDLEVADSEKPDEICFDSEGIALRVEQENINFLRGTEIDCVTEGLNEFLKFKNPNVKGECGCGESFSIEES